MNAAVRDMLDTFKRVSMIAYFAWSDTKARYKRSLLGPFWIVLGTAIGVAGLGFLWSALLKVERATFIPSLTLGIVVWQFIAGCFTESTTVLTRHGSVIRNIKGPYLFFPFTLVARQLVTFAHNAVVILFVLILFPPPIGWAQWLVVPGLFLLLGNLLWISTLIGMLGARFRDLEPLIGAVMPMLFFLSPVIYRPENLGVKAKIIWLNPFTYLISLVRDPLQGVAPSLWVYTVSLAMFGLGWLVTLLLLGRRYHRVPFWI